MRQRKPLKIRFHWVHILLIVAFLWGCAVPSPHKSREQASLSIVDCQKISGFVDDLDLVGLTHAIQQSLSYYRTLEPGASLFFGNDSYTVEAVTKSLEEASSFITQNPSPGALGNFICNRFRVYRAGGEKDRDSVKFTGYYEPFIMGAKAPTGLFAYPIYGKPKDLATVDLSAFSEDFKGRRIVGRWTGETFIPYYDRSDIESTDALSGKADILAWAKDPVDLFFLQIQGSGRVILSDGEVKRIQYAGSNGRPYRSIGKWLMDEGRIPKENMSMQAIRDYLALHPGETEDILKLNPSYVFFKVGVGEPKGSIGVPLTPGRSIATDSRLFPKGALGFIQTRKPVVDADGRIAEWIDFSRFVVNQDTGGAIRGPARADIFWGSGPYAEIAAGYLQHMGQMYFLSPLR
jgi:membrane-bound lytic murein transglycosylase A